MSEDREGRSAWSGEFLRDLEFLKEEKLAALRTIEEIDAFLKENRPRIHKALIRALPNRYAKQLRSALHELGAIDERTAKSKGALRQASGLTERQYRKAVGLLKAQKAVRTKTNGGTWLVS